MVPAALSSGVALLEKIKNKTMRITSQNFITISGIRFHFEKLLTFVIYEIILKMSIEKRGN